MKLAVLTSSRADYAGISPLLRELKKVKAIDFSIVAFGTHVSGFHGYTLNQIKEEGYKIEHVIESMILGDTPQAVATAIGVTTIRFSDFWANNHFDLILTTGDRYEMYAAALAALPFNIPIAHIHGGEDTEGAIDNVFRHSLSLMATYHFTTTNQFAKRIEQLKKSPKSIYAVGALSIDAMKQTVLMTLQDFKKQFGIDLSIPTILITIHPETSAIDKNELYIREFVKALKKLNGYQLLITMPNADALGNLYRKHLNAFVSNTRNAYGVESLGNKGYFTAMKHCVFMLGNSSSGFVEASYFPKYVINVGDRQKGRIITANIFNCAIREHDILKAVRKIEQAPRTERVSIYGSGNTAKRIVQILKKIK